MAWLGYASLAFLSRNTTTRHDGRCQSWWVLNIYTQRPVFPDIFHSTAHNYFLNVAQPHPIPKHTSLEPIHYYEQYRQHLFSVGNPSLPRCPQLPVCIKRHKSKTNNGASGLWHFLPSISIDAHYFSAHSCLLYFPLASVPLSLTPFYSLFLHTPLLSHGSHNCYSDFFSNPLLSTLLGMALPSETVQTRTWAISPEQQHT